MATRVFFESLFKGNQLRQDEKGDNGSGVAQKERQPFLKKIFPEKVAHILNKKDRNGILILSKATELSDKSESNPEEPLGGF